MKKEVKIEIVEQGRVPCSEGNVADREELISDYGEKKVNIPKRFVSRIYLLRKAAIELYEDKENDAALSLSLCLIWRDLCSSPCIVIPEDGEITRKIFAKIDSLLIGCKLIDICKKYDGDRSFTCEIDEGEDVEIVNVYTELEY